MKSIKHILAIVCSLALLFSAAVAQAEAVTMETARFSTYDMNVNYVYVYATREEATAVFGSNLPDVRTETSQATGETVESWVYGDMTLSFNSAGKLIGAEVYGPAYTGPRGIRLGMTPDEVSGKFYRDPGSASNYVFYTAGYVEVFESQLPPCGYVRHNDDGTFSFLYEAPAVPYGDDVIGDPTNYVYQETAALTVTFDQDGKVARIGWWLGALAE
ncbi:MAG: hypothetical protein ABIG45_01895 [Bacillota bacterium]